MCSSWSLDVGGLVRFQYRFLIAVDETLTHPKYQIFCNKGVKKLGCSHGSVGLFHSDWKHRYFCHSDFAKKWQIMFLQSRAREDTRILDPLKEMHGFCNSARYSG